MARRKRIAEGVIKELKFEPHPGEYAARYSGELHCREVDDDAIPLEIHFEETSAVAHSAGVRLEYRSKRWYFFEGEFHLFLPLRLLEMFEDLCFETDKTKELIEPVLFFAVDGDKIANLQNDARLTFPMGETFVVELAPR